MVLSIYAIVSAATLIVNALAILSETRLLSKFGLATTTTTQAAAAGGGSAARVLSPSVARQTSFSRDSEAFVPAPFDVDVFAATTGSPTSARENGGGGGGDARQSRWRRRSHLKTQIALLLSSVRMLLRWPLIIVNTILIVLADMLSRNDGDAHARGRGRVRVCAGVVDAATLAPACTARCGRRRDGTARSVALWSAVALQQHLTLSGVVVSSPPRRQRSGHMHCNVDDDDAVALTDATTCLTTLPPAQPRGRLTLAQKMGLVPLPPPPPSEDEWRRLEARALLREQQQQQQQHLQSSTTSMPGTSVCCICYEPFSATWQQTQVLLSCSHVFHERCFAQFERLLRRQQRADAGGCVSGARLACPVCRRTHYHKRVYYASRAAAQRAQLVRLQAMVRMWLARRRYAQLRLAHNAAYRAQYVHTRLARLSAAWEAHLRRRAAARDALLADVDARQQTAAAAFLCDDDWRAIRAQCRRRAAQAAATTTTTTLQHGDHVSDKHNNNDVNDDDDRAVHYVCAICLETIVPRVSCARDGNSGDGVDDDEANAAAQATVQALRRAYEAKRHAVAATPAAAATTSTKTKAAAAARCAARQQGRHAHEQRRLCRANASLLEDKAQQQHEVHTTRTCTDVLHVRSAHAPDEAVTTASMSTPSTTLPSHRVRLGVLLSCSHCFHRRCLDAFERYCAYAATPLDDDDNDDTTSAATTTTTTTTAAILVAPRCPVCRRGYATREL